MSGLPGEPMGHLFPSAVRDSGAHRIAGDSFACRRAGCLEEWLSSKSALRRRRNSRRRSFEWRMH